MRTVLLCTIMFVSGAAALLFETLWFRQAGLAFGNGVWASSLVLASFMAGLAVGNAAVARYGAKIRRPVRFYAGVELAIGAAGLALVHLLPLLGAWLFPVWRPLLDHPWLLNPLRLLVAFALLLAPATAMGVTLPVLVKALRARDPSFGAVLGRLYGWNTLGAVVGAVIGEAVLIEALGVRGSAAAAAGLNGAAAIAAFALAPRLDAAAAAPAPSAAAAPAAVPADALALLLAAACSGAILLSLEVVWFRFLHLFVYDTSASFALVLAVVLAGIGCGGAFAGGWLRRRPDADGHAPLVALLAGLCTLVAYGGFDAVVAPVGTRIVQRPGEILWLSTALMLPVSLCSGVLFTVTGAALARHVSPETRAAGWLTFANTVGAAAGAFVAGFALLPGLGVEASIFALAAGYAAVAALLWRGTGAPGGRSARRLVAAGAAFAVALALFPFGRMEAEFLPTVARRFDDGDAVVVAAREGLTETVIVLRKDLYGEPVLYRLVTGGFGMASTSVWARRYMKQFVYWPVALHPAPEDALLISYGIGNTAKALVDTRELRHIDVVDISRDVLAMSEVVHTDPAEDPLRDPRVEVHVDDGRFFLSTTTRRYDLITSEPPPPKHAGIVNLYTREYFALIRDRLKEGGINTYWLPVHSLMLTDTLSIIRAYCQVFEDCSLWTGAGYNWMLVGSRGADGRISQERFERQWRDPGVAPELRALGFERPEQLGATFLADARELRAASRRAPPLVDDFPKRLSDRAEFGRMAGQHRTWMDSRAARRRFADSAYIRRTWPPELRERTLGFFAYQQVLDRSRGFQGGGSLTPGERLRLIHAALTRARLPELALWLLGVDADQLDAMDRHLAAGGSERAHPFRLGARALAAGDFAAAARWFAATGSEPFAANFLLHLRLYALCRAGLGAEAASLVRAELPAAERADADAAVLTWLEATCGLPPGGA